MSNKYRPILPAASSSADATSPGGGDAPDAERIIVVPKPKRSPVYTACNHCRRRKIKCDGKTPACTRCIYKRLDCEYDVEPDVSRQVSLKRKYEVMQDEASQLKELYRYLHERPEPESFEILRRIRTTRDPLQVLRFIKEGDLLIQGLLTGSSRASLDPRARRLDDEALEESPLKLRARPWTSIAHDGLVSELVSSFLMYDQPFYFIFLDKDRFLDDMVKEDANGCFWCSQMLVNAICALRCLTSARTRRYGLIEGVDLGRNFYDEARRLFDLEYGKASVTTIQALLVMFMYSACIGCDRAGLMYRYTAYEMLQRLNLEKWYRSADPKASDPKEVELKRSAVSRLLWGLFSFECLSAFIYLKKPLVKAPLIARNTSPFMHEEAQARDICGRNFDEESQGPPIVPGLLEPLSQLSELMYQIMSLYESPREQVGTDADVAVRFELYEKLQQWRKGLSSRFSSASDFTPQNFCLSCYHSMAVIALFRPLDPSLALPEGSQTTGQVCLATCADDVKGLAEYERRYRFDEYSVMVVYPMYNASMTLVSRLDEPLAQDAFTNVCRLISGQTTNYIVTSYLLKALWALAKQLRQVLPPGSIQHFKTNSPVTSSDDIPISFVLPQHEDMAELLSGGSDIEHGDNEIRMGKLISRWDALSLK